MALHTLNKMRFRFFFNVSYKSGKVLQNIWSILNAAFSNFIEAVTFRAVKDKKCIVRVVIVVRHFVHKKIKCKFPTTFTAINRFFVCLFDFLHFQSHTPYFCGTFRVECLFYYINVFVQKKKRTVKTSYHLHYL